MSVRKFLIAGPPRRATDRRDPAERWMAKAVRADAFAGMEDHNAEPESPRRRRRLPGCAAEAIGSSRRLRASIPAHARWLQLGYAKSRGPAGPRLHLQTAGWQLRWSQADIVRAPAMKDHLERQAVTLPATWDAEAAAMPADSRKRSTSRCMVCAASLRLVNCALSEENLSVAVTVPL